MRVAVVGKEHPLAAVLPAGEVEWLQFPFSAPPESIPDAEGLLFLPPLSAGETYSPVAKALKVPYQWLHRWVPEHKETGGKVVYGLVLDGVYGCEDLFLSMREGGFLSQMKAMALELARYRIRVNGVAYAVAAEGNNPLRVPIRWEEAAQVVSDLLRCEGVTGELVAVGGGLQLTRVPIP